MSSNDPELPADVTRILEFVRKQLNLPDNASVEDVYTRAVQILVAFPNDTWNEEMDPLRRPASRAVQLLRDYLPTPLSRSLTSVAGRIQKLSPVLEIDIQSDIASPTETWSALETPRETQIEIRVQGVERFTPRVVYPFSAEVRVWGGSAAILKHRHFESRETVLVYRQYLPRLRPAIDIAVLVQGSITRLSVTCFPLELAQPSEEYELVILVGYTGKVFLCTILPWTPHSERYFGFYEDHHRFRDTAAAAPALAEPAEGPPPTVGAPPAAEPAEVHSRPVPSVAWDAPRIRVRRSPSAWKLPTPPDVSIEKRGTKRRVWFGTNRATRVLSDVSPGFSGKRGSKVTFGYCDVWIPESHRRGEVGHPLWWRILHRVDDRLKIRGIATLPDTEYWERLQEELRKIPENERHAVVFLHGYNVSFAEAAIRSAQFGSDLGIPLMSFFSWPSRGKTGAYIPDTASIEASEGAIAEYLGHFASLHELSSIHVIAHSMGNRGLLRAFDRIVRDSAKHTRARFNQIILAAPDVDRELFQQLATCYSSVARRTTLYVSERDHAVAGSRWLHQNDRVGYAPPVTCVPGIDTVNVTGVDLSLLGHGYVAAAKEVLWDMHQLLVSDLPPNRRMGLREANQGSEKYWQIRR